MANAFTSFKDADGVTQKFATDRRTIDSTAVDVQKVIVTDLPTGGTAETTVAQQGSQGTGPPVLPGGGSGILGYLRGAYDRLDGIGADGNASPANGSGVRGWLRSISDKLNGTVVVSAASLPLPNAAGGAAAAAQQGAEGSSPPVLPGAGSGIVGYLRGIYDRLGGSLQTTAPKVATAAFNGSVTATSSAGEIRPGWSGRSEIIIGNDSADSTVYLWLGTGSAVNHEGIRLEPGATFITAVYTGRIAAYAETPAVLTVVEL